MQDYNTLVIDFPWNIPLTASNLLRRPNTAKNLPYKTMDLIEIENFYKFINEKAADGAHLYFWATNRTLPILFKLIDKWGYKYHLTLCWLKPSGIAPAMGYVFGSEFLVLCFKNSPRQKFLKIGILNWLIKKTPAGHHSEKPEEFYNKIAEMSPAPRLDIFARRKISGFDGWGDEYPA